MNRALIAAAVLSFAAPATSFAADYVPIVNDGIPGLTDTQTISKIFGTSGGNFAVFFNNLYIFAIGIAVFLAIAMIIWGGVEYALSEAITSKSAGKKRIQQALFGLLLVLSPALVFTIINPAILKLDVNFPPLDTGWGKYTPTAPDVTTGTENSCGGTDCSVVAKKCTDVFADPPQYATYQCVNADGTIASDPKPDTKPIACKSGQTYYVACSSG